jgi:uncharacterized HhH-GPD family protein
MDLCLAQDIEADAQLSRDPLALLVGMLLDQQFPMERAFASPYELARRLGVELLSAKSISVTDPQVLAELFATPPALHRFPGAMAGRVQALCELLVADYDGDPVRLWAEADSGTELLRRLQALPGFGRQKAQIFLALLGKQAGIRPKGWREAAGAYGDEGSRRSVADVTDQKSLLEVREHKKQVKAAARAAKT